MDAELKIHLEAMEGRIGGRIDGLEKRVDERIDGLEKRVDERIDGLEKRVDERIDGLEKRVHGRIDGLEKRVDERIEELSDRFANLVAGEIGVMHREMRENFDRIDARLNRQGEMLTNGTKALGGLVDYVERADANYARLMREMEDLRARVASLEKKVA